MMAISFAAYGLGRNQFNRHRGVSNPYHDSVIYHYEKELVEAIASRDLNAVIAAAKKETGWKNPHRYYESVLHLAVKKRSTEPEEQKKIITILKWFIKQKKFHIDTKSNRDGITALQLAVRNGMIDVVDCLIERGADFNSRDSKGNWIIHHMIEAEFERYYQQCKRTTSADELRQFHRESVLFFSRMLAKKIPVDCTDKWYRTPLQLAAKKNLLHVMPILLDHSEDVKCRDTDKKTVLHLFIEIFKSSSHSDNDFKYYKSDTIPISTYKRALAIDIMKMMLSKGYSVNAVDNEGNTPLHYAAYRDHPEFIDMMLKDFKKINACNEDGNTVLHIIIGNCVDRANKQHKEDYVKFVRALLSKGADINKTNKSGYKAIHLAIMRAHPAILKVLKEHGADLKESYNGGNLLHLLSQKTTKVIGSSTMEEVISILIREGCDVNAKDKDGLTPMHVAAKFKRNAVITGLVKCHANVDIRDSSVSRLTPLQMSVINNYDYSIDTLINNGADINAKDSTGKTALHMAARLKNDMIKMLLVFGAHVDIKDDQDLLPLHYAIRNQNGVALEELLKYGADINDVDTIHELLTMAEPPGICHYMIKHWIKMNAAELPIPSIYRRHASDETFQQFYLDCLREIEGLKDYRIGDRTSLYDLMHMDWNSRCAYTVNRPLKELIESAEIYRKFPKYHVLISASYHNAVTRQPLLEPAKRAWCEFTKILLPDVCVYRILAHLNNRELIHLVDGLKDRSFRKPCNLLLNANWRDFD